MDAQSAAAVGADIIQRGFEQYHDSFRATTRRVKRRFERRDWAGIRDDTVERLNLHPRSIRQTYRRLRQQLSLRLGDRALWVTLKESYTAEILGRGDFEVAQTYFNSLVRRFFPHAGVDPEVDFMATDFPPLPYAGWELASARTYAVRRVDETVVRKILEKADLDAPFRDLADDARLAASAIRQGLRKGLGSDEIEALDVLRPLFVRNKGAYIIGRARRGSELLPIILCLLNDRDGVSLDAVLPTENEASVVFSFARWYFHADVRNPREVIGFLHSILPRKRTAELYISLGYNKHGKTEFYGDLVGAIERTDEQFIPAPGKPGMVMTVFTLPSYEFVFKVIRDRFAPPKNTTAEEVRARYRQVLRHDRVGRLVDFQEFERLDFPRRRFSEETLAELLREAAETVKLDGDRVIVRHLYVGRRVTPLDIHLHESTADRAAPAVIDWGQTLKELAAADIFAGDIQLKNFGITRHGRVVFYDYDELCPLSACRFRRIPPARTPEDEMAAEPWFSVDDEDVFPEEFPSFLGLDGELYETFCRHHADLFDIDFWRDAQRRNRSGEILDFYPYAHNRRLRPNRLPAGAQSAEHSGA
jgi:isocitrate dehydrogenase kinase/phosphatase